MYTLIKHWKHFLFLSILTMVLGCESDDNTPDIEVKAAFTYTVDGTTVSFINISENASTYVWEFGDDATSTEKSPTHAYATEGTYTVKLTAKDNSGQSNTASKTIMLEAKEKFSLPITFDNANLDYDFAEFGGAVDAIVDNPNLSGSNDSASKVMEITNSGVEWEGAAKTLDVEIDFATDKRVSMDVYATSAIPVLLKFEVDGTQTATEISVDHGGTGWETLNFDFNSSAKYNKVAIFIDGPGKTTGKFYVDNIIQSAAPDNGGGNTGGSVPTTAPTTPTADAADVISIFSDAYTDVTVDTFRTDWSSGATVLTDESIAANNVKKYANLGFVGIETTSNTIDASNMTHFHMDVWTADATEIKIKLVDFGANGVFDGGDDTEHELVYSSPTQGQWISYDIPLSDFTGLTNKGHMAQYIISSAPAGSNTLFIDNIYFYSSGDNNGGDNNDGDNGGGNPVASCDDLPSTFETDCSGLFSSVFTGASTITADVVDNPFKTGINTSNKVIKVVKGNGATRWAGFQHTFTNKFDLSSSTTFKYKIYSPKPNLTYRFELSSEMPPAMAGLPAPVFVNVPNANEWTEVTVTFNIVGLPNITNQDFDKLVIKPDNPDGTDGTNTSSEETYYFDDFRLE